MVEKGRGKIPAFFFMDLIILAGGKSSRFGRDKAFARFDGVPIIEKILHSIGPLFNRTIIVTNRPESYKHLKCRVEEDVFKNIGPLGGIHAGLKAADAGLNLVAGCDMPLIKPALVRYLLSIEGYDAVVPAIGGLTEPLLAVYSKNCLPAIEGMIKEKTHKISLLYNQVRTKFVAEKILRKVDPGLISFNNFNTLTAMREYERKNKNNQI